MKLQHAEWKLRLLQLVHLSVGAESPDCVSEVTLGCISLQCFALAFVLITLYVGVFRC